jgi:hypothetical protein
VSHSFWAQRSAAQLTRIALASDTTNFDRSLTLSHLPWPLPSTFPLSSMSPWSLKCQQAVLDSVGSAALQIEEDAVGDHQLEVIVESVHVLVDLLIELTFE